MDGSRHLQKLRFGGLRIHYVRRIGLDARIISSSCWQAGEDEVSLTSLVVDQSVGMLSALTSALGILVLVLLQCEPVT